MLTKIRIENFKSLRQVELDLGNLNILIGTNASGKSNFFDALRVLQGIGYGFTVGEIFDGKPKSTTSIAWDGIRGGTAGAICRICSSGDLGMVRLGAQVDVEQVPIEFTIKLDPESGLLRYERLTRNGRVTYTTDDPAERDKPIIYASIYPPLSPYSNGTQLSFLEDRPLLGQLADNLSVSSDQRQLLNRFAIEISDLQPIEPLPSILREYSQRQTADRLGEHGEDFAALVKTIRDDISTREQYVSWLREMVPSEVDSIEILKGALGEPLFAIKEGGRTFAAPLLSDGTLRFAALTAALFQPDTPAMLMIEEIENGIHPTRLRLLVELLRSRAAQGRSQLFITTHSPLLLAWLKPEEYEHTFLCVRQLDGASEIRPVSSLPHFIEVVKQTPFSDLFAEGWLETAI